MTKTRLCTFASEPSSFFITRQGHQEVPTVYSKGPFPTRALSEDVLCGVSAQPLGSSKRGHMDVLSLW